MTLRRLLKQKPALLAGALLMVAGAATLYFPETWYPEETQWQLATEKDIPGIQGGLSGLTWNPDSGTLFAVTDHPSSVVELDTDGNGSGYSPPTTLTGIRLSCRRRHTP